MTTEVEKLEKSVNALQLKKTELEGKQEQARAQIAELENERRVLLANIAEGDEGARSDLKKLDSDHEKVTVDAEAFSVALTNVSKELETTKAQLSKAQDAADINALEIEMESLALLDSDVEAALVQLDRSVEPLISKINAVATRLRLRNEVRWGSGFGYSLVSGVRDALLKTCVEIIRSPGAQRVPLIEGVRAPLRSAISQLRYENLGGHVEPKRGEQIYRTLCRISGLHDLDLDPGSLIALRPDEATDFVEGGSLALVDGADEMQDSAA